VLDCVLRQHVWSSEAWLSKHMASLILVRNVVGELQRKRTLAASRGFLADSHGYGYGMGMGTVMNPHGFCR